MTAIKAKRCPRCGRVKAAEEFYRRRGGRQLSPYCRPCSRATAREAHQQRRQNRSAAAQLRAVDRARQRRRRTLGGQGGVDR
jgi:hypothetical protein